MKSPVLVYFLKNFLVKYKGAIQIFKILIK